MEYKYKTEYDIQKLLYIIEVNMCNCQRRQNMSLKHLGRRGCRIKLIVFSDLFGRGNEMGLQLLPVTSRQRARGDKWSLGASRAGFDIVLILITRTQHQVPVRLYRWFWGGRFCFSSVVFLLLHVHSGVSLLP